MPWSSSRPADANSLFSAMHLSGWQPEGVGDHMLSNVDIPGVCDGAPDLFHLPLQLVDALQISLCSLFASVNHAVLSIGLL